jgi:O-acetyl-ADP-ribose deacetylase (regulator of RNase III)
MELRDDSVYYLTHKDNLPSILSQGILSRELVEKENVQPTPIGDGQIIDRRRGKISPDGKSLPYYVNLFFQPRNPMLYRVLRERRSSTIVIIKLRQDLLYEPGVLLVDGNAAHSASTIFSPSPKVLQKIKETRNFEYWRDDDGTKRKIMAECLVPERVPPDFIECIYVASDANIEEIRNVVRQNVQRSIDVVSEAYMFFKPQKQIELIPNVTLIEGDMFFSQMQTLTVSVNTVGVMGKGLASRAKYQFPDVYVAYQDLCKSKKLKTGKPWLVTRETSLVSDLSETPQLNDEQTWFLLFPTKEHWRENSQIDYVIDGLKWVEDRYQEWGVKSLALPALGCGLGKLTWEEVGPIMCSAVANFDIPVCVYLPTEKPIPAEQLTKEFLVRRTRLL